MTREATLTPKAELIRSRIAREWSPHKAIAEFVDNSLAPNKGGADAVYVEVGPNYIEITDLGIGCDDINRLFCLGDSSSYGDRTDIGLYGVGATDACIWLGTLQAVETVSNGRLYRKSHEWRVDSPAWPNRYRGKGEAPPVDHPLASGGTRIRVSKLRAGRRFRIEKLQSELGRLFGPGLLNDKKIFVRRGRSGDWQAVAPHEGPPLDPQHSVRWTGAVDGKEYFAEVGWMLNPRPDFNALHIAFEHRLIERTTDFFLDKRSSRLAGWLYLTGDWKYDLEDHKGCLVPGPGRVGLMRQVYEKALPLIEEAQTEERHLALANLAARLNHTLENVIRRTGSGFQASEGMPSSSGHSSSGTASSTLRSKSQEARRKAVAHGDLGASQAQKTGIYIDWFEDPEQRLIVQTKHEAGRIKVLFNTKHPEIARAVADPANHFGLVSTAMRCVSHLIAEWSETHRRQVVPAFELPGAQSRIEVADGIYAFLMRGLTFTQHGQLASST